MDKIVTVPPQYPSTNMSMATPPYSPVWSFACSLADLVPFVWFLLGSQGVRGGRGDKAIFETNNYIWNSLNFMETLKASTKNHYSPLTSYQNPKYGSKHGVVQFGNFTETDTNNNCSSLQQLLFWNIRRIRTQLRFQILSWSKRADPCSGVCPNSAWKLLKSEPARRLYITSVSQGIHKGSRLIICLVTWLLGSICLVIAWLLGGGRAGAGRGCARKKLRIRLQKSKHLQLKRIRDKSKKHSKIIPLAFQNRFNWIPSSLQTHPQHMPKVCIPKSFQKHSKPS